jgi:hypothetical protein
MIRAVLFALLLAISGVVVTTAADAESVVVLDPQLPNEAGLVERFRRRNERPADVRVMTHPAEARLEFIYLHKEQVRLRQRAMAPARLQVRSPQRADQVLVRASQAGYRNHERTFPAGQLPAEIEIALEPLPNALVAASHIRLVGRNLLLLWTLAPANVRVQEAVGSVHLVLPETRSEIEDAPELSVANVGDDLFVAVPLEASWQADQQLRAHQSRDSARGLERIVVEWVPADGGLAATEQARAGLARLGPDAVDSCAHEFEERLRQGTPASSLARAFAPTGRFLDAIHRGVLRRLAELRDDGLVEVTDGSRFDPMHPIEADLAMGRAGEVLGYLAVLDAFVGEVATADEANRVLASLIAPDLPVPEMMAAIREARRVEDTCRVGK